MENECEALPGVAYPGVRDNRSTINTKTGYDEYDEWIMATITHRKIYWPSGRMDFFNLGPILSLKRVRIDISSWVCK